MIIIIHYPLRAFSKINWKSGEKKIKLTVKINKAFP
jgi:hypothetical protein